MVEWPSTCGWSSSLDLHDDAVPSPVLPAFPLRAARRSANTAWPSGWSRSGHGSAGRSSSALNPAGTTPVMIEEGAPAVPGAGIIAEYLDETRGARLARPPPAAGPTSDRIEVRRLTGWFNDKFFAEVSGPLVDGAGLQAPDPGPGRRRRRPTPDAIRAAHANIRYHLAYIGWLARHARLARRRHADLCGSRRGRASVGHRLSGRRAVERGRGGKELVRAGEVAAVVPRRC